jgi:MFS family permease
MRNRPLAIKFGRRPIYLTSNFLMGMACIWLAIAAEKTYVPFIVGRAFLGLFEAPIEAIVPSTVTDIFYLHERGEKISVYGLGVLGGNEIGPLVSAFIIQSLSVRWAFFIVAISIFINQLTLIFFMPETKFTGPRPSILPPAFNDGEQKATSDHFEERVASVSMTESDPISKKSYLSNLPFCAGVDRTVNLRKTFFRPFILMTYPTVLWSSTIYGLSLGWNVILGICVAQLFAPPPYNFTSGDQGLIFLSPFIGSLAGTYLCGPLADRIANWATKRNHGIREPEMRLPACIIAVSLTFFGALIASLTYRAKTHWAGPIVGFGVLSAGAQMGATLAMAYSLDCHKEVRNIQSTDAVTLFFY